MVKPKRDVCSVCHFNLLCFDQSIVGSSFYCVNCEDLLISFEDSFVGELGCANRVVPAGCRFSSHSKKEKKKAEYADFVRKRIGTNKISLEANTGTAVFYSYEMRFYMCERCAPTRQIALNNSLEIGYGTST